MFIPKIKFRYKIFWAQIFLPFKNDNISHLKYNLIYTIQCV